VHITKGPSPIFNTGWGVQQLLLAEIAQHTREMEVDYEALKAQIQR